MLRNEYIIIIDSSFPPSLLPSFPPSLPFPALRTAAPLSPPPSFPPRPYLSLHSVLQHLFLLLPPSPPLPTFPCTPYCSTWLLFSKNTFMAIKLSRGESITSGGCPFLRPSFPPSLVW